MQHHYLGRRAADTVEERDNRQNGVLLPRPDPDLNRIFQSFQTLEIRDRNAGEQGDSGSDEPNSSFSDRSIVLEDLTDSDAIEQEHNSEDDENSGSEGNEDSDSESEGGGSDAGTGSGIHSSSEAGSERGLKGDDVSLSGEESAEKKAR
jgi:hypothetical protein